MCGIFAYKGNQFSEELLTKSAKLLKHRGPDLSTYQRIDDVFLAFHRLSIVDLSFNGNQPFVASPQKGFLVCNGEIYNSEKLRSFAVTRDYQFRSTSDCEVLVPMLTKEGIAYTARNLDAEFALIWYDKEKNLLQAARDPIGIRPLFYGRTGIEGEIAFASEAKALTEICEFVKPFPPGCYFDGKKFVPYRCAYSQIESKDMSRQEALQGIYLELKNAVHKRMQADAPIGFLLSGGLDSSLVCSIAAKLNYGRPIRTFSVGSSTDAIDNPYAEEVARHIEAEHTTVTFTQDEVLSTLDELIRMLETWDVTTVRASIGMYLVCKHIRNNTDVKVLMTGEVSDELFGYKYTDFAPSAEDFQQEARKRIREIHMYDVLRADRCISAHGLEARVPFGDLSFVDHVMKIPAEYKMNSNNIGKYLLRKAFDIPTEKMLPENILYREKAAFSDAVGHSVADGIKDFAEQDISDPGFLAGQKAYSYHCKPMTKEALLYRQIFEKHFPGQADLIADYWLPNRTWQNCDVLDPSARVLPNYGKSGQ